MSETVLSSVRSSRKYPSSGSVPTKSIIGAPSSLVICQPFRMTQPTPPGGLYSSIHSSAVDAAVPAHATSLMTSESGVVVDERAQLDVAVIVGVDVAVGAYVTELSVLIL